MAVQVFISGVHTGAGLGVARALRARYPNTRLVGVSYAHPGEGILGGTSPRPGRRAHGGFPVARARRSGWRTP